MLPAVDLVHEAGCRHDRDPATGDSIWTDPDGRTHVRPATTLPTPGRTSPAP